MNAWTLTGRGIWVSPASSASERALVVGVLMHVAHLAAWEPALELLGALEDFTQTDAGLTPREVDRAIRWGNRLAKMDSRLVVFYAEHAPVDETASVALWKILEGGGALEDWQYRKLKELWTASYGFPPAIELCPRF